jgi:hypothetical protein
VRAEFSVAVERRARLHFITCTLNGAGGLALEIAQKREGGQKIVAHAILPRQLETGSFTHAKCQLYLALPSDAALIGDALTPRYQSLFGPLL